ncbi:unnamed protein product [Effrenium voratum]|uniref:K Homology domain-containing protein n=1 Tax=Effrenium voratum TaxID=2562239 RepID=A0AA36HLM0_9DINO|nr:unnamed protein product [Effrenium voratum]
MAEPEAGVTANTDQRPRFDQEEAEEEAEEEKAVERTPEELPRVPCHIFLPVVPAARVIGKQGANIKAIREQSAMPSKFGPELPHEMQRREDRVAVITGDTAAVQEAISGVLERVFDRSGLPDTAGASARDRDYIVEVLVPEKSGSHLIGQKGDRVKALCQETRCDIRVGQDPVCGLAEQKKARCGQNFKSRRCVCCPQVRISATTMPDAAAAIWRPGVKLQEDCNALRPDVTSGQIAGSSRRADGRRDGMAGMAGMPGQSLKNGSS